MEIYRGAISAVFVLALSSCTPLIGPQYDWISPQTQISTNSGDNQACRSLAMDEAGDRPTHKSFIYSAGSTEKYGGATGEQRIQSRSSIRTWTARFDRSIQRCMAMRGFVAQSQFNRLSDKLKAAVETDNNLMYLVDIEAMEDYLSRYIVDKDHKAFAVSVLGAWAWVANLEDNEIALEKVMADCNRENFGSTQFPCTIVNINGTWVMNQE